LYFSEKESEENLREGQIDGTDLEEAQVIQFGGLNEDKEIPVSQFPDVWKIPIEDRM